MSDEPNVLAATVMRSLPSAAYHARRALAALESQNQALQENYAMAVEIGKQYLARADNAEANWEAARSQNQALQERIEELKTLLHDERLTRYKAEHSLAELVRRYELRIEQAVALQERAAKAEAALRAYRCEGCGHQFQETAHVYGKRTCCPDCSHGPFIDAILDVPGDPLSPTQETDRPDIEEIGRGIARDFGKTFDILAKADRPAQETDPG